MEKAIAHYIPADELKHILFTNNKAVQLLSIQDKTIKEYFEQHEGEGWKFVEM